MKRLSLCFGAVPLVIGLSACAPAFTTTTNADVRQPENLRREQRIQKSIDQAYANIAAYAGECQPVGNVVLSPDRTKITISETAFGPQMRSVYMVVDIQAMGASAIDFKGYSYYGSSMWKDRIDTVLKAINDSTACA
ncbi:hypothetical protein [Cupriavidus pauculus]|uniref:hypothetical protein n=1 Tax=Cupriavidus pauculus TaxID=82633 RepID=UPI001243C494|nr:hypothetical protein [Cupriavidus pauculus]KAB0597394.1 hypothetical protein F7R19_26440 [Cupriavidus pauculus]MCM3606423.1 hypothetical protein [Cupriavidus pauculus]UAL00515.1 hypothetical protein K8O84_03910 [Cupriavidus pauculus]